MTANRAAMEGNAHPKSGDETMRSEDVKEMATNAIETLAAALDAGKSSDLKCYLAAMGRFHRYRA
jgi:hypothetical protein